MWDLHPWHFAWRSLPTQALLSEGEVRENRDVLKDPPHFEQFTKKWQQQQRWTDYKENRTSSQISKWNCISFSSITTNNQNILWEKKKQTYGTRAAGLFALFCAKLLMKSGTEFHKQNLTSFDHIGDSQNLVQCKHALINLKHLCTIRKEM